MTESPRTSASRIGQILLACLTAIAGFFAFNVFDGVFGLVEAIVGLLVWTAVTVFVVRRPPRAEEAPDA